MSTEKVYGLIGRHLGHSYSSQIHRSLLCKSYEHIELEPEQLENFFKTTDIGGLNVTIPYKKAVIPFCRELTPAAEAIGSVNTIVAHPDGGLIGHNTDAAGFEFMVRSAGIDMSGKKVVIFGTGGAYLAVRYACTQMGAREIVPISRSGENNYENLFRHYDAEIVVNATPVGMYPNLDGQAADLSGFECLEGAIDLVYNPRRTNFLLQAEKMGAVCADGLAMLVAQAARSEEMFFDSAISPSETERVIGLLAPKTLNIVLIGMPGCGKSTIGACLSKLSGFECIDTDEQIVKKAGKSIPEIFAQDGEEHFRRLEHEVIDEATRTTGKIIITGGGAVKTAANHTCLRRTGCVFHIERDVASLPRDGRPLSASADLNAMYLERLPLYRACRDRIIENSGTVEAAAERIWRDFIESSGN